MATMDGCKVNRHALLNRLVEDGTCRNQATSKLDSLELRFLWHQEPSSPNATLLDLKHEVLEYNSLAS